MSTQFVAEITLRTDASGTQETFYFCSGKGFATRPDDTPANTWVAPRLVNPGSFRRELFSGNRLYGAVRPSFGVIEIANPDGALDEWAGYSINGGLITLRMGEEGGAYPDDYAQVMKVYGDTMLADFTSIQINVRDRLSLLDKPILNQKFAGTGDLEGNSDQEGMPKPRMFGDPGYCPVILIDSARLIYFAHCEPPKALASYCKIYEGGVEITRGADYSTEADCLSTAPAAGQCRWWFGAGGNGPTVVRLGSPPTGDLRIYSRGYTSDGSAFDSADLAVEAGVSDATESKVLGLYYLGNNDDTYLRILEDATTYQMSYFGFSRLDVWQHKALAAPAATALHTFNQHNAWDIRRTTPQEMSAPVAKVTLNSGKTYPCAVLAGAGATIKDRMTRTPWAATFVRDNASVLDKFPSAPMPSIDFNNFGIGYSAFNFDIWADTYMALYGVERDFIELKSLLDETTMTLDLHDTVEVRIPRFGLSSGKKFRIVSVSLDLQRREMIFGLWG